MTSTSPGLNAAQMQAVHHLSGPCLVLAGAGSGKTRVITHKIARLIQAGYAPGSIAAITFTNKAAAEMRERAKSLIGKSAKNLLICTFHSLGVRILRQDGDKLGLKSNFSILDADDTLSLIKDCGATTDKALARSWQWRISLWKNQGLNAEQALAQADNDEDALIARIMVEYESRLLAYQSVDFDDLIDLPLLLLRKDLAVQQLWQERLAHILVDEYQDTNATQYQLLKLLLGPRGALTAVGDDDQSIYGWRGATLDNLKRLPQDYPQLRVIKLEQNYRSTGTILRAANRLIALNPKLFPKTLYSELGEGEPVRVFEADDETHEADRVASQILRLRNGMSTASVAANQNSTEGYKRDWRDFAVLYRANHQAKVFEQALRKAQIPYKVSGGTSFFDRTEIKDLCAWMRLWVNERDDPAFLRAVSTPKRGVGAQTLSQLGQFASRFRLSLFEALFSPSLSTALSGRSIQGLHDFGRLVSEFRDRAEQSLGKKPARQFLDDWLQAIGYEQHLYDNEDNDRVSASRWERVQEFCDWIAGRCDPNQNALDHSENDQAISVLRVAQTISLLSTLSEAKEEANVVTLSTLHAAKGLEWPHVYLVGVNEGSLPFSREEKDELEDDTQADEGIEEERRLMYVGITRAQHDLQISWLRRRKVGRNITMGKPSRFIAEMALHEDQVKENPREKLKSLRAELAQRLQNQSTPQ